MSGSRKFRASLWAVPYARGRTRLRFGGTVQDPTDSVYHRLRSISLDEMPAAFYNTVATLPGRAEGSHCAGLERHLEVRGRHRVFLPAVAVLLRQLGGAYRLPRLLQWEHRQRRPQIAHDLRPTNRWHNAVPEHPPKARPGSHHERPIPHPHHFRHGEALLRPPGRPSGVYHARRLLQRLGPEGAYQADQQVHQSGSVYGFESEALGVQANKLAS
jgi:hypothetical protein